MLPSAHNVGQVYKSLFLWEVELWAGTDGNEFLIRPQADRLPKSKVLQRCLTASVPGRMRPWGRRCGTGPTISIAGDRGQHSSRSPLPVTMRIEFAVWLKGAKPLNTKCVLVISLDESSNAHLARDAVAPPASLIRQVPRSARSPHPPHSTPHLFPPLFADYLRQIATLESVGELRRQHFGRSGDLCGRHDTNHDSRFTVHDPRSTAARAPNSLILPN